jgi:hypothetical protein
MLIENPEGGNLLENLAVYGNITSKWTSGRGSCERGNELGVSQKVENFMTAE